MYDEFPFVPWHLPPLERHEPRRILLARTLEPKIRALGLIPSNIQVNYHLRAKILGPPDEKWTDFEVKDGNSERMLRKKLWHR